MEQLSSTFHFPGGPVRTTGDGRENPDGAEDPVMLAKRLSAVCIKPLLPPPEDLSKLSFSPVKPVGEIVHLTPHLARVPARQNSDASFKSLQGREPKFVPYEPYKGAVHPMVMRKSQKKLKRQASTESVSTTTSLDPKENFPQESPIVLSRGETELRAQLARAGDEIQSLEAQLRFQEQVNSELKRMLVAAVGEDVEVKVQHLTEDKLHLARALVNNSESISSHQEKLEYVTGQCEVWRSKFLASSLMVDELARWKTEMVNFTEQLKDTLGVILKENGSAKEAMKVTCRNLQLLRENFDPASGIRMGSPNRKMSTSHLPSTCSLTDIATANQKLSETLGHRLLGYIPNQPHDCKWDGLQSFSSAELRAIKLLQNCAANKFGLGPDEACSAVVGAAAAAGSQLFPHVSCTPTACCGQCQGEIHQL
ncbi:golgin-45 [Neocloeon triangulifer]|uniref:golgin-45 n=1 Tax=Neocloeon triangulifer TaxID=2078957 RepID=UPI00286F273B|nr:golgin-45 [Neocloeon triangulifer]